MSCWKMIVASIAVGSIGLTASAQNAPSKDKQPPPPSEKQPPPGDKPPPPRAREGMGPREPLSPEKSKAAWAAQAKGVSARLGLDETKSAAVVKAYTEARQSQGDAADKLRKDAMEKRQEGGGEAFAEIQKKIDELNKTEREKFEKALSSSLSADQTSKASASLGLFNRQWDVLTDTVLGFNLDAKKSSDAANAVEDYVVSFSKVRPGQPNEDRAAARTAMQEARKKLSDTMKAMLTEDQFKKFEGAMAGGMRAPGPRGGGQGGDHAPGGG